ncbi:hypothetical protein BDV98DRAFT_490004, partial [Pterulicium gracile]
RDESYLSKLLIALATADGPGMIYLNELAGHKGKAGCRLFWGMPARRSETGKKYLPAFLK